ncbi:ATP-binding protein [cf. Phormidesmis sp. LEGE 11477]|uniref:ATP-binding protein n=1 Tax=cf. Phormidesmis sp. LEGE 11477 TaxID=1828680 RepID=UPI00187EDCFB|nr:ATP-binding protein [cf. Phormidesmis sp. LEGE 11477]MBE9060616.1 hypothetical protein [cf. Phormidesmis sp. LEGE 11477]
MLEVSNEDVRVASDILSAEAVIELIVRDTAASTGQSFFEGLVRNLAQALHVRHCLLTELLENGQLRTLAFWRDGEIAPSITYDPAPGPCGVVLDQDIYYCEYGVQQKFPHQPALPLLEAESYVGVSLRNHQGKILGNLALLDSSPILERKLYEDLLKLFATRASAELERQQAIKAIEALNAELELRVENRTARLALQAEELKKALADLKQTQADLIHSAKMSALGRLVGGVAHELNNPISFIKGNLTHAYDYAQIPFELVRLYREHCDQNNIKSSAKIQTILEKADFDYVAKDLPVLFKSMHAGVERIEKIVRSLRTFSRLDESSYKSINLNENLSSILLLFQDNLYREGKGADIQIIEQYGDIPDVTCYPGELNQAFINLLYNAIAAIKEKLQLESKHQSASQSTHFQRTNSQTTHLQRARFQKIEFRGIIRVTTKLTSSSQVAICISDNGVGISEKIKEDIFDPFFTTRPVGRGIGLGLSTAYQIITERHGGSLEFSSSLGQGSEFVMHIPLTSSPQPLE